MDRELWTAVLRIVVFLPLVVLLAYFSIKFGASRGQLWSGSGNLRLVERIALGPKAGLCIVKVGQAYYLIGVSEENVALLKELPHYEEPEKPKLRGSWSRPMGPGTKE